jgi:hypothetical protein
MATVLVSLLVGFVSTSNSWAETTSDVEVKAPEAETAEAEEDGEEEATSRATTYQQIAQWRANAMAKLHNLSHSIHKYSGAGCPAFPSSVFEGIGMSSGGTPGTCNNGGRVLADAMAVSSSGTVYRVRFFTTNGGSSYGRRSWGRRR